MFGHKVALKKREPDAAAGHFTWEEGDVMWQKLDAMDTVKADAPNKTMPAAITEGVSLI